MNRIKDVLKEKNISVAEFADMMGVSRQAISKQLAGKLLLETLEKFASVLNVPVWELLASREEINALSSKEDSEVSGYVKVKGTLYEVHSFEDLKKLLELNVND